MKMEIVKTGYTYCVRRKRGFWPFSWYEYLDLHGTAFWWTKSSREYFKYCLTENIDTAIRCAKNQKPEVVEVVE